MSKLRQITTFAFLGVLLMASVKILNAGAKLDGRLQTALLELARAFLASTGNVIMDIATAICCGQALNATGLYAPTGVPIVERANLAVASASLILPGSIVASRFVRLDARDTAAA